MKWVILLMYVKPGYMVSVPTTRAINLIAMAIDFIT